MFFFSILNVQSSVLDYKSKQLFSKDCSKDSKQFVVKYVFDGDTVLVENVTAYGRVGVSANKKIRLLGIDAFELEQNQYGPRGKEFLSMLVSNKNVCIETDVTEKDIYNRTLGYVFINSLFINAELLKNGLAILNDFPPNIKYISRLKKAQRYARENMSGIWKEHNYIKETPSQWRHEHPYTKK